MDLRSLDRHHLLVHHGERLAVENPHTVSSGLVNIFSVIAEELTEGQGLVRLAGQGVLREHLPLALLQ